MTEKQARRASRLLRVLSSFNALRRNKRGLIGLAIIVVYSLVALAAPFLTPYDPISTINVGGSLARPSWARFLPGGELLSENLNPLTEPFDSPSSLETWATDTSSPAQAEIRHESYVGRAHPGSLLFNFKPGSSREVVSSITAGFVYPYSSWPARFIGTIAAQVSGYQNVSKVTIEVRVQRVNEALSFAFWGPIEITPTGLVISPSGAQFLPAGWLIPTTATGLIDSFDNKLTQLFSETLESPAKIAFPRQGNYLYTIEVRVEYPEQPVPGLETNVYIDDVSLRMLGTAHGLLGTEIAGRDTFTQLVYGARISLLVGLLAAAILVTIGMLVGLIAGFLGGSIDEILMRFTDMLLVVPGLPLLIVLAAVLGSSIWNIILILGLLGWTGFARVVRSQVLTLKERPFVEAARAVGAGTFHITSKHVLPNVMGLVYVSLATAVPGAIISEAALSFLGLFDPTVISWGRMLNDIQVNTIPYDHWWLIFPPGFSIAVVSLAFILIGYALDEHFNPKLRKRR